MQRIAKFQKVSEERFVADWTETFAGVSVQEARAVYGQIRLPRRATAGSAGYDFFAPARIVLNPGETIKIPTGIRAWRRRVLTVPTLLSMCMTFMESK